MLRTAAMARSTSSSAPPAISKQPWPFASMSRSRAIVVAISLLGVLVGCGDEPGESSSSERPPDSRSVALTVDFAEGEVLLRNGLARTIGIGQGVGFQRRQAGNWSDVNLGGAPEPMTLV